MRIYPVFVKIVINTFEEDRVNKGVRRVLGALLGIAVGLGSLHFPTISTKAATASTVQFRTQEEIANYYNTHYFSFRNNATLDVNPDISADVAGVMNQHAKQEALNALNFVRFVAGLNAVTLNEQYQQLSQYGAALLEESKQLSHNPSKPSRMSDAFFQRGLEATGRSNLAFGYQNLAYAIIDGWLDDTNPRKVTELAHRRWILDPDMNSTGFGKAGEYTQMYVFDGYNQNRFSANYIPWPATNTPSQVFAGNWSIILNPSQYGFSNEIVVYVKDKATGRTTQYSGADREDFLYSYERGGSFGRSNAIVFEPGLSTDVGKSYQVRVSGLKSNSGRSMADIIYDVNFFNIENVGNTTSIRIAQNSRAYEYTPREWEDIQGESIPLGTSSNATDSNAKNNQGIQTDEGNARDNGSQSRPNNRSSGSTSGGFNRIDTNGSRTQSQSSQTNINITPEGEWVGDKSGRWGFLSKDGYFLKNTWAKLHNPYSKTKAAAWFYFDETESLKTGWLTMPDGRTYYLNPISDGTKGEMLSGWQWLVVDGVNKCYHFSQEQNSNEGMLLKSTSIDGWTVDEHGVWVQNGQVITKEMWDAMQHTLHAQTEETMAETMSSEAMPYETMPSETMSSETTTETKISEGATQATTESTVSAHTKASHQNIGPTVPPTLSPETEGSESGQESAASEEQASASGENTNTSGGEDNAATVAPQVILSQKPVTSSVKRYTHRK